MTSHMNDQTQIKQAHFCSSKDWVDIFINIQWHKIYAFKQNYFTVKWNVSLQIFITDFKRKSESQIELCFFFKKKQPRRVRKVV